MPDRVRNSLSQYLQKNNPEYRTIEIDSIHYTVADSTIYFNRFLDSLAGRSESFSRMARLQANLAQSHMDRFLAGDKNISQQGDSATLEIDKSLEALKNNERAWDVINDSMDLMLHSIHDTDTLNKVFYDVSFLLKAVSGDKKIVQQRKAILNKEDFKVVFYN